MGAPSTFDYSTIGTRWVRVPTIDQSIVSLSKQLSDAAFFPVKQLSQLSWLSRVTYGTPDLSFVIHDKRDQGA